MAARALSPEHRGWIGARPFERRKAERRLARWLELSLDLLAVADFSGYFTQLNPAWTQTLGHSLGELCSRPFIQFVHPDDRERTEAEAAKLMEAGADSIVFRNRYRHADGSYRWLEWNARAVQEEGLIYASARDITIQQEAELAIRNQHELLEQTVRSRTRALNAAKLETLQRLALVAEYRDDATHRHTKRVGHLVEMIARNLGLPADEVRVLGQAAPLHDIGKLGIADSILLKRGNLSPDEVATMREHTRIGARILSGSSSETLERAREIALTHHERWDGAGYPEGLRGHDIPLAGRITAVADVFDALTHERPYKRAWPLGAARAEINILADRYFDPEVVDAFITVDKPSPEPPPAAESAPLPARSPKRFRAQGDRTWSHQGV